jgi:hypothetical protein
MDAWREQLERAIAAAHPACSRCGDDHVPVEWRDGDGWIPVQGHYVWSDELFDACPALNGGYAAWDEHNRLWAAIDLHLPVAADYGAVSFARRELVAA